MKQARQRVIVDMEERNCAQKRENVGMVTYQGLLDNRPTEVAFVDAVHESVFAPRVPLCSRNFET